MMKYSLFLFAAAASAAVLGKKVPAPDADGRYTLEAPGIRAQVFINSHICLFQHQ